ncbi:hypothetical protein MTR67_036169 [Solanum verrucosum]|uniref:Uncharacterized protein n=1 Tax=Solanum verrucosum TaxID=315347 RepID=A0AAF0ZN00_SOLVR|nr:hypothetical protein MTR67_036169 [Solanum verrucosum]
MFHVFGPVNFMYSQLQKAFAKNPVVKHNLTSLKHVGSGAAPLGKEVNG